MLKDRIKQTSIVTNKNLWGGGHPGTIPQISVSLENRYWIEIDEEA